MLIRQADTTNILLRTMQPADYARIAGALERVELQEGLTLARAGEPLVAMTFIEAGVVSYADVRASELHTGIGMVGYEGFAEWQAALGCELSTHEITVAVGGGSALRLPVRTLLAAAQQSGELSDLLLRFVRNFVVQLSATAASNLNDAVERRLCRWLLMNHDRLPGDDIALTHQAIGTMLGVRRASVTDALHVLEGQGLIRAKRGCIMVRDRQGLRKGAGQSYGIPEAEYALLIAPFGKDV